MEQFIKTISEHNLIEDGDRIVIGVSGGPDSICLLHLLWSIKERYNLELFVVHLNHQFRGHEADKDAQYVKEFCDKLGVKSFIYSMDVEKYSKKMGITFEEAGRELRYKLFNKVADKTHSNKIAVAQNRNDQAETVLMRLIRGAGLEGLSAIDYIREDKIIRPLLDISRKEIEDYCLKYKLKPRIDKTNLKTVYTRNKIRLELIPYIEKNFNPNIIQTLWRSANILRDDDDYLNEVMLKTFNNISFKAKNKLSIDLKKFKKLHVALKRRIIRKALEEIKGNLKGIGLVHIDAVLDLIKYNSVGGRIDLPEHIIVELGYNSIDVKYNLNNKNANVIGEFEYSFKVGEFTYIKELKSSIKSTVLSKEDIDLSKRDRYTIYVDYNKIKGNLTVRNRRKGDRFTPLGMRGSKKLKDFFIDQKIPKDFRDHIPILCDESGIIWIVGYRMNEKHKIDSKTDMVVKFTYEEGCIEN
jgi:tRNA(Ile)-lysidine synthase